MRLGQNVGDRDLMWLKAKRQPSTITLFHNSDKSIESYHNTTDVSGGRKSYQCFHLCLFQHLTLFSPGSWDDSGLLTVFLLTSGV